MTNSKATLCVRVSFEGNTEPAILRRHNLKVSLNGRPVDASQINWREADIRQFQFTQPPSGTNVLGGRGSYIGTVAGVILITLLQSILSVLQPQLFFADYGFKMPAEVFRQVVFGVVIISMLLLYGRDPATR